VTQTVGGTGSGSESMGSVKQAAWYCAMGHSQQRHREPPVPV
jgi:hypothetical protein